MFLTDRHGISGRLKVVAFLLLAAGLSVFLSGCGMTDSEYAGKLLVIIDKFDSFKVSYSEEFKGLSNSVDMENYQDSEIEDAKKRNNLIASSSAKKLKEIRNEVEGLDAPNSRMQEKKDGFLKYLDKYTESLAKSHESFSIMYNALLNVDEAAMYEAFELQADSGLDSIEAVKGIIKLKDDLQSIKDEGN
ncbi:MAG: hypothetical protein ACM3PE_08675 [Deltaproteobacteria bacterium]